MIVYRHRRNDTNSIFYIGISSNEKRAFMKHKRAHSKLWNNIVNKHGYTVEILAKGLSWEDACELEVFLISEYGCIYNKTGLLCNMTEGGEGITGFKHSAETIQKMKVSASGRQPSMACILAGIKANTGRLHSKESIIKQVTSRKDYSPSYETRQKISVSSKGRRPSDKCLKAGAEKASMKVIDTNTGIIYPSIKEAAETSKYSLTTLYRFLSNKYPNKTTLKLYVDECERIFSRI